MKWFQHHSKARHDSKLTKVLIRYGAEGYGLYWYCIEHICENLEPALTFELEHDAEILAHHLKIDSARVQEMMVYMVQLGLFDEAKGVISCRKLARYLGDNITRNADLKAIIRAEKEASRPALSQTVSDSMRLSQREERKGEERKGEESTKPKSSPPANDPVPVQKIVDLYHEKLPTLPACKKVTDTRRGYIKQRWKEGDLPDLETWENYFDYVSQSDFLMGRTQGRDNRPPFMASLEWLCKPANYTKIYEGNYHRGL